MIEQEQFFHNKYKHLRLCLKFVGLWPYQSFMTNFIFFAISLTIALSILVPQLVKMIEDIHELDKVFDSLPTILVAIFCAQMAIGCSFGVNNLRKCFDKIMIDWSTFASDTEIQILTTYAHLSRKLAVYYYAIMSFATYVYLLQPLIYRIRHHKPNVTLNPLDTLPYRLKYGVDLDTYYYPVFIHCWIALQVQICIFGSLNFIYTACIQHARAVFIIIGYRLENLCKNDNSIIESNNIKKADDKHYYDVLECLRLHIKAIEFCNFLESIFTITYLFSLGINMILLTLSGIEATLHLDDIQRAFKEICLILSVLCQLFWQSWQAQFLLDSSIIPYESILRSKWYQTSTRCKRLLLLILVRGAIPSKLTAGKICTLSIETFSMVLRTSMSYFTVLRSVQ